MSPDPCPDPATELVGITRDLCAALAGLRFAPPVACVYNPLDYARGNHEEYLQRFGGGHKRLVFVGMNPGPWGMAQTGVPFGDIPTVRDWLKIDNPVHRPLPEHPKRPVTGLDCQRVEVSGSRLWGWVRERFATPKRFFTDHLILNYCPLMFMEESARNRTPDRLPSAEREALFAACDRALRRMVEVLEPSMVIGIGAFAARRAAESLAGLPVSCEQILHPSPASPAANRGWADAVNRQLQALGVALP